MKFLRSLLHFDGGCIPWWMIIVLAALFALAMQGCAAVDSYWVKTHEPMPIKGILETETPGGRHDLLGNANYETGMIEVKPGLHPTLRACVLRHEARHFAGYTHEERKGFATDCGDGTMVPAQP